MFVYCEIGAIITLLYDLCQRENYTTRPGGWLVVTCLSLLINGLPFGVAVGETLGLKTLLL